MAKNRYINTKIWSDNYFSNLDPIEKLLFIYIITNEKTTICGVYELPIKIMSVETGIEKEMIEKIFKRFEFDNKIKYQNGWIAIKNFIKHQDQGSPKVKIGIDAELKKVPKEMIEYIYSMDTLSDINININSNSNSNINSNTTIQKDSLPSGKGKTVYLEKIVKYDSTGCLMDEADWTELTLKEFISMYEVELISRTGIEHKCLYSEIGAFNKAMINYIKSLRPDITSWQAVKSLVDAIEVRFKEQLSKWTPYFKTINWIVKNKQKYYNDL